MDRDRDAGFTLLEVMVSIAVITTVVAAVSTFAVQSISLAGRQRGQHAAVLIADGAVERVRTLPGSLLANRRDQATTERQWNEAGTAVRTHLTGMVPAYDTVGSTEAPALPFQDLATVNGVGYTVQWYLGRCWRTAAVGSCGGTAAAGAVEFFRVVVAVTWPHRECAGASCTFVTATVVSNGDDDAVFNINDAAMPPAISYPGAQAVRLGTAVHSSFAAAGGSAPLSWSGSGLPDGLRIGSDGLVTGTPTRAGSFTATIVLVDAFGLRDEITVPWTVYTAPACANPGAQSGRVGTPVSLTVSCGGGTPPLAWTGAGLPTGLSLDGSTGVVSGTPGSTGTSSVTLTATDRRGLSSSVDFSWTIASAAYSTLVLADGPLGYWRLGETGGTTAVDSSGTNWHGTYQPTPLLRRAGALTGDADTAVSFNGSSGGVTAPDRNDFVGTAPFSLEAWVRPTNLGASTDYKSIVRKYGGSGYWLWMNSTYGFGFERSSTGGIDKLMSGPVQLGVWQHVVVTFNGSVVRMYVNGALRGSMTSTRSIGDTSAGVQIGFLPSLPSYTVQGDVDEVAIYGAALPGSRITAHYQKGING